MIEGRSRVGTDSGDKTVGGAGSSRVITLGRENGGLRAAFYQGTEDGGGMEEWKNARASAERTPSHVDEFGTAVIEMAQAA